LKAGPPDARLAMKFHIACATADRSTRISASSVTATPLCAVGSCSPAGHALKRHQAMQRRRRVLSVLAVAAIVGSACQPAAPAALAGGGWSRAASLRGPGVGRRGGGEQGEGRRVEGQARGGSRDFGKGIATAQAILDGTTRADLVSAARLLKGQALRGLERW